MRINRIIGNTIIGLTSLIGSSNIAPKATIATAEKLTNRINIVAEHIPIKNMFDANTYLPADTLSSVEISTRQGLRSIYRSDYKPLPLEGTKIMVNPGHGIKRKDHSMDYGKIIGKGKRAIREADINDKVAENVRRKLEKLGATVIYVDNTEVHAIQRLENEHNPDVFVAIHQDAKADGPKAKNSGETMYAWTTAGKKLAKKINNWYKKDTIITNNGLHTVWAKELCVLNADSTIPAVLVEGGFLTNKRELKILNTQDYQNIQAQNITQGIRDFIEGQRVEAIRKAKAEKIAKTPKMKLLYEQFIGPYKPTIKINSADKDI